MCGFVYHGGGGGLRGLLGIVRPNYTGVDNLYYSGIYASIFGDCMSVSLRLYVCILGISSVFVIRDYKPVVLGVIFMHYWGYKLV